MIENVDRRVLGAIRFISAADDLPVPGPLRITPRPRPVTAAGTPPFTVLRNRLGLYVIHSAPEFSAYQTAFDPVPATPEIRSVPLQLRVTDPSRRYFPADFEIPLPRSLDSTPVNGGFAADSVFTPVQVTLYPAPSAPVADGWAVLRVLAWREEPIAEDPGEFRRTPLNGALVRVLSTGASARVLARSFVEWRRFPGDPPRTAAEAMVAVRGIPVTTWNEDADGAVLTQDQPARLQVRFDTQFTPGGPEGPPPDMSRLEPEDDATFPEGVIAAQLASPLTLRARLRQTIRVVLGADNQLRSE